MLSVYWKKTTSFWLDLLKWLSIANVCNSNSVFVMNYYLYKYLSNKNYRLRNTRQDAKKATDKDDVRAICQGRYTSRSQHRHLNCTCRRRLLFKDPKKCPLLVSYATKSPEPVLTGHQNISGQCAQGKYFRSKAHRLFIKIANVFIFYAVTLILGLIRFNYSIINYSLILLWSEYIRLYQIKKRLVKVLLQCYMRVLQIILNNIMA